MRSATALKGLTGFADRSSDSARARAAYEECHARCLKLATQYHGFTGHIVTIPGLLPDSLKAPPITLAPLKVVDLFADDDEPPSAEAFEDQSRKIRYVRVWQIMRESTLIATF